MVMVIAFGVGAPFYVFDWWKLWVSGSFLYANTGVQRKQVQEQTLSPIPPTGGSVIRFTVTNNAKVKWNTYNVVFESTLTY